MSQALLEFNVRERVAEFVSALPSGDNAPRVAGKDVSPNGLSTHLQFMRATFWPGNAKGSFPYTWIERVSDTPASQSLMIMDTTQGPALVLQIQFRAPANGWVVETAGGLVDAGEKGEEAAAREAKEEMPILFTRDHEAPEPLPAITSCGLTNERSQLFVGTGELKLGAELLPNWIIKGATKKEDGEVSIAIAIPTIHIVETLAELERHGISTCARLACYIQGAVGAAKNHQIWFQKANACLS